MSAPTSTMNLTPGPDAREITFHLSLVPVMGVDEMETFHRVASSRGKTVAEAVVEMIREELREAAMCIG